jgi:hypothetical protein
MIKNVKTGGDGKRRIFRGDLRHDVAHMSAAAVKYDSCHNKTSVKQRLPRPFRAARKSVNI